MTTALIILSLIAFIFATLYTYGAHREYAIGEADRPNYFLTFVFGFVGAPLFIAVGLYKVLLEIKKM